MTYVSASGNLIYMFAIVHCFLFFFAKHCFLLCAKYSCERTDIESSQTLVVCWCCSTVVNDGLEVGSEVSGLARFME
jgi:hypothetical protein